MHLPNAYTEASFLEQALPRDLVWCSGEEPWRTRFDSPPLEAHWVTLG